MMQNATPQQGNDSLYQPPVAQGQGLSKSGMALAGFVLGIIALLTSFLPIINNFAALLAILGLIFGIVGLVGVLKGKKSGKGMAIAAVALNPVALVVVLASQAMFGAALDEASKALDEASKSYDESTVSTEEVTVSTDEAPASEDGAAADAPAAAEEKYVIEGETMTQDDFSTKITGTLTNNTDKEIGYLQLSYTLYDADGAQVGSAFANVSNLEAGGVWKFEAVSFESGVVDYKLADVTGF